jgi:hypothetical protein
VLIGSTRDDSSPKLNRTWPSGWPCQFWPPVSQTSEMEIRTLSDSNAAAYWHLRLEALHRSRARSVKRPGSTRQRP